MSTSNIGTAWTLEEEQRLYEATCRGESLQDMAAAHGRTTGGILSRQKHMGLRDETGTLIVPTPEFRSALSTKKATGGASGRRPRAKPPTSSVLRASSWEAKKPSPVASPALSAWPADFPHGGDWIEKLWCALSHDAVALLSKAEDERPLVVILAQLTPEADLHPPRTLADLGNQYGVTRERIRQILVKSVRRLSLRVLKADSLTKRVLDAMTDAAPEAADRSLPLWFAIELAQHGCRREFMEFVLMAVLSRGGTAPYGARQLVARAMAVERARRREERPRRRRERDGEVSERTEKADAFVLSILRKAAWPERLSGRPIDLSGMQPLRDCVSEKAFFSSTLRRRIGYDSQGELRLIRALDRGSMATEFLEQPLEIPYEFEGASHSYFPDVLVRVDDDLFFVIEIKARQRLADCLTLAKSEAAQRHLGTRGIGYCLADADGFGLSDLHALELDDRFGRVFQALLERCKPLKRRAFERAFESDLGGAYDQLQAAVLRRGLRYETSMWTDLQSSTGYGFDFSLSQQA